MTPELGIVAFVLALATGLGFVWKSNNGKLRSSSASSDGASLALQPVITEHGSRLTFVQFSSEVCSPCRQTARVLSKIAAAEPGVVHQELQVTEHSELTRRLNVLRTPTVYVLDGDGEVVGRMSGSVSHAQAIHLLD